MCRINTNVIADRTIACTRILIGVGCCCNVLCTIVAGKPRQCYEIIRIRHYTTVPIACHTHRRRRSVIRLCQRTLDRRCDIFARDNACPICPNGCASRQLNIAACIAEVIGNALGASPIDIRCRIIVCTIDLNAVEDIYLRAANIDLCTGDVVLNICRRCRLMILDCARTIVDLRRPVRRKAEVAQAGMEGINRSLAIRIICNIIVVDCIAVRSKKAAQCIFYAAVLNIFAVGDDIVMCIAYNVRILTERCICMSCAVTARNIRIRKPGGRNAVCGKNRGCCAKVCIDLPVGRRSVIGLLHIAKCHIDLQRIDASIARCLRPAAWPRRHRRISCPRRNAVVCRITASKREIVCDTVYLVLHSAAAVARNILIGIDRGCRILCAVRPQEPRGRGCCSRGELHKLVCIANDRARTIHRLIHQRGRTVIGLGRCSLDRYVDITCIDAPICRIRIGKRSSIRRRCTELREIIVAQIDPGVRLDSDGIGNIVVVTAAAMCRVVDRIRHLMGKGVTRNPRERHGGDMRAICRIVPIIGFGNEMPIIMYIEVGIRVDLTRGDFTKTACSRPERIVRRIAARECKPGVVDPVALLRAARRRPRRAVAIDILALERFRMAPERYIVAADKCPRCKADLRRVDIRRAVVDFCNLLEGAGKIPRDDFSSGSKTQPAFSIGCHAAVLERIVPCIRA